MRNDIIPFVLIFGLQFCIVIWFIVRNFTSVAGGSMEARLGASGRYFFSRKRYGKYKGRSTVSAGVPVQNGFVFSIWRRNFWHRFLTPLGLAQDIRTGDPLLDDTFYFMTDDDERLKTLVGSSGFVATLRDLFQNSNAKDVECRPDKIWFNTGPIDDTRVNAEAATGYAARLAAEVQKLGPGYAFPAAFPLSRAAFLYRIGHVALLVLGVIMTATLIFRSEDIINKKDFFMEVTAVAPVAVVLWLALLVTIFGKTSWFPQVCGSFMISGFAGLLLMTCFMVRETDIDFDLSPPEIKSLRLQAKSCWLHCTTGGKHARTSDYMLSNRQCSVAESGATIAAYSRQDSKCRHSAHINYTLYFPWPTEKTDGDTENYTLKTDAQNFERTHINEAFSFPLHAGRLGLAWIRKGDVHAEN